MRMKFKNLRRPARILKAGIEEIPPKKKSKSECMIKKTPSLSDVAEYNQHIKFMQKSYSSQKWSFTSLDSLLEATSTLRRKWIKEDCPTVEEVLLKFPCLQEHKLVSGSSYCYLIAFLKLIFQMMMEFCRLTASDKVVIEEKWNDTKRRIICYAAKEDGKQVKSLLTEYNLEADNDNEGRY